jgi:tRNA threonylcarbamoyladenosine biosynthesis protein TsaE
MKETVSSVAAMQAFGRRLGQACSGGEVIELIGDIGAGKTTLTKGIAVGLGVEDEVQSPTFTLSRTYHTRNGGSLVHYDFYRLSDPGILAIELADIAQSPDTTVVIEWADTVHHVLPADRLMLTITAIGDEVRTLELRAGGARSHSLLQGVQR